MKSKSRSKNKKTKVNVKNYGEMSLIIRPNTTDIKVIKEVLQIIVVLESMAELVMRLTNTEQVID